MAKDKEKKKSKEKGEKKVTQTLRVQLTEDSPSFSFRVAAKELDTSISKVSAVLSAAGNQAKNFALLAAKGRVVLIGYNPETYVYLLLKTGEAQSDGCFGFQSNIVQGVIKGRNDLEFHFKSGDVEFKDPNSRYAGTFHTQAVAGDQVNTVNMKFRSEAEKTDKEKEEAKRLKLHAPAPSVLPRSVLDCLKEGISLTSIKDIYAGNALLSYMQLTEQGVLTVSAFDGHHFGLYRCKVDAGGMVFKAAMPSSHFLIIDRMVEDAQAKFHVQNESIRVEGDGFAMILPSVQTDERNYNVIPTYVKEQLSDPDFKASYGTTSLNALIENLFSLYSTGSHFEISHKGKSESLQFTVKANNGSASDTLKVKPKTGKDVKVKIDPRLLKDIHGLFKSQSETNFSIYAGKVIRIDAKTKLGGVASLMCALS